MRTVIGEYASLALATSAVCSMQSQISIQGIVIADQTHRTWRRPRAGAKFLVSMTGSTLDVERARALLSAHAAR
jgi:hypothetical protein